VVKEIVIAERWFSNDVPVAFLPERPDRTAFVLVFICRFVQNVIPFRQYLQFRRFAKIF
jgi:hypothetical protein